MEKKPVNYANLKRLAPGPFSERMLDALSKGVDFENFHVEFASIELGDDPFTDKLNVTFYVETKGDRRNRFKGSRPGPKLFFTFSSADSPDVNLQELREFIREHADTAGTAPTAPQVQSVGGHLGD